MKSKLSPNQLSILYFTIIVILFVIFLASCKKTENKPSLKTEGKTLTLANYQQQQILADNSFTLKLFKNLDAANQNTTNLFVSPLSASFALGMTSNGANGTTFDAFKRVLNFNNLSREQINTYYNNLITNLPQLDPNTTLDIANSIWFRKEFSVLPAFLQTDSSYFHATVSALDFNNPTSINIINNWVSSKTGGNIPTILNTINNNDLMFLINTIYFKSVWKEKFNSADTKPMAFYLNGGNEVQTDFMSANIDYNYTNDNGNQIYELPYSNSKFSMVIALPPNGISVKEMVSKLDSSKWQSWMSGLHATKNQLLLPKFKFSFNTGLKNSLTDLGLGIAFSDGADFSLLNSSQPLTITDVKQKAYIAIDESGTTAAAATSVSIGPTLVALNPPAIDNPFFFVIRDMNSGIILFAGEVNNPTLSGE